jgi:hypothetical protein
MAGALLCDGALAAWLSALALAAAAFLASLALSLIALKRKRENENKFSQQLTKTSKYILSSSSISSNRLRLGSSSLTCQLFQSCSNDGTLNLNDAAHSTKEPYNDEIALRKNWIYIFNISTTYTSF